MINQLIKIGAVVTVLFLIVILWSTISTPPVTRGEDETVFVGMPTKPAASPDLTNTAPAAGATQASKLSPAIDSKPLPQIEELSSGSIHGWIYSRDPMVLPPYQVSLTKRTGGEPRAIRCVGEFFEAGGLEAGDWTLEIRRWDDKSDQPVEAMFGSANTTQSRLLLRKDVRLEAKEVLELELWVGHDPAVSAHLLGYLEGPNIDLGFKYVVSLTVTDENGGRFEERALVDDQLRFDFGFVPPGEAHFTLYAAELAPNAVEDLLVFGDASLVAAEQTVLPIRVPGMTRVHFRIFDGSSVESIQGDQIYWSTKRPGGQSGMILFPRRSEIVVPAGEYVALALRAGFAAEFVQFEARNAILEVDLHIEPAATRLVRLLDSSGNQVQGALIRVNRVDGTPLNSSLTLSTKTNDEGVFDASAFPKGQLGLEVFDTEGRRGQLVVDRSVLGDSITVEM